jgi:2-oxoisovalerate dehydrogenase E2 component (dihydrolipoyl transacylase)
MPTVTMPQLGESVAEGTILRWMKQPGDPVALDESLCEIETEKVTAELPSPFEGLMGRILVPEGETVLVGAALCEVGEPGAAGATTSPPAAAHAPERWLGGPMAIPPDEDSPQAAASRATAPATPVSVPAPLPGAAPARAAGAGPFLSPAVLRLASARNIDPGTIRGTGANGRVTKRDLDRVIVAGQAAAVGPPPAAPAAASAADTYTVVTLTPTRRAIAERLTRSNLEAPQAWTMVEADVTGLVRLREREKARFQRETGVELTLLPYFTQAACQALAEFPSLNARWEGPELRQFREQHVGIAVAADMGLIVPVVHGAGALGIPALAAAISDLAERARSRKLTLKDIEGGTFTVNNTGAFGSIASKPIVNYPQVAIVTMERAVKRAVVADGDIMVVRWMMNVCLSFDHRALDGLEAGRFLAALRGRLEAIA